MPTPSGMPILPGQTGLPSGLPAQATPQRKKVHGPKVLLQGEPGNGKTDVIRTLLESGLNVFVFFTEPGMEVLMDRRRGKVYTCGEGLHWIYIPPVVAGWDALAAGANLISTMSYKAVSEMNGTNKEKYRQYFEFIAAHTKCKCDRCGREFGDVGRLEPYDKWAVVYDSLTSLSIMALNLVIGDKPAAHQGEWGMAMMNLERFINKACYDIPSMMVLLAHIEREGDEVTGGQMNMASTLGRKLAPKIPRPFSDVIHARREGTKFMWSTITPNMLLKTRSLELRADLLPSFRPIVEKWHASVKSETEYWENEERMTELTKQQLKELNGNKG